MEYTLAFKVIGMGCSCHGSLVMNPTSIHEDEGSIPGPTQWVKDPVLPMSYGVGWRQGSDLALLWLWYSLAAVALIWPLAWELPYAVGAAPKRPKEKRKGHRNEWNHWEGGIKADTKMISLLFCSQKMQIRIYVSVWISYISHYVKCLGRTPEFYLPCLPTASKLHFWSFNSR